MEIIHASPRPVSFGIKLRIFFREPLAVRGMTFLIAGLLACAIFLPKADFRSVFVFSDTDPVTQGIVDESVITGNENDSDIYKYTYHYSVNGTNYTAVSYGRKAIKPGDPVQVLYKTDDPSTSHIKGMRAAPFGLWLSLVSIVFPLAGLAYLWFSIKKILCDIYLLQYGIVTKGTIMSKEASSKKINNKIIYDLHVRFPVKDRSLQDAYVKTHNADTLKGEEALVYDPGNPSSVLLLNTFPKQVRALLTNGTAF